ncbi:mucin-associated surface protein [Trypanosoma cruzi cruzi]|uniref:Mucin-associated surface protein (MASP) n=1 Tax=Trypanosoma cruzi TaxID=5693 RepID=A0A2V2VQS3_TRYCR|nr:mucin-associated surface protein [Trypanosoma cruzi cruzi]PWU98789.1 Mucin-associated surface protein (MASP) [Trypanosoma cruzi]
MAMMMTGRVLLVCALCVLWCGAGGGCEEAGTADTLHVASSSVVRKGSQESSQIAQGGSQSSGLKASDMKDGTEDSDDQQTLTEDVDDEEEEEEEEEAGSDEEDQDEDEDEDKSLKTPEEIPPTPLLPGGGGGVPQAADGKLEKLNEIRPKNENQRQVEGGTKNQREKETEANGQMKVTKKEEGSGPQPNNHQTPVQEEDTRSGEVQQLSQGKEQKTNVEEIPPRNSAGDRSSGEHNGNDGSNDVEEGEEGVEGHERDRAQEREEAAHVSGAPKVNSTDIQQEVQRTHAGETPTGMKQRAGEEKDDETEEEREEQKEQHQENPPGKEQETITGANATNQINTTPGDSDGSTAVSHTTSPLLLLLFVACAAAAAVVAA